MMDNMYAIDFHTNVWRLIVRLLLAGVCGFIIGYERKTRSKEAGIRTHTIVAMAAALMMIISKYGFADLGTDKFDGARIAAQIITGIGFLGAGMIVYRRDMLHGLTTAAGIWATAGIGMALGSGMLIIGFVSTVLLVILQAIFHLPIKALKGRHYSIIKAQALINDTETITQIKDTFNVKKFLKFKTHYNHDGTVVADIEFVASKIYTAEELFDTVKNLDCIQSIEKNDEI